MRISKKPLRPNGLVLAELIVAVIIISFMMSMAMLSFSTIFGKTVFEKEVHDFINVMKMAQDASAETDRRYAVILDFAEQTYTLREFISLDLETLDEDEAILTTGSFSDNCRLDYVLFDDFDDTRDWGENILEARFMAGRSGWQYGGKIVLLDDDGNPYSVIVNRLSKIITLVPDDIELLEPKYEEDVPF